MHIPLGSDNLSKQVQPDTSNRGVHLKKKKNSLIKLITY